MMRKGRVVPAALVAMIVVLVIAAFAPFAVAQSGPVIETAELRLWPEYDDPGLLVIFSGEFASGTAVPLTVSFPVPEGARNVQATYEDDSGALLNRPFEIQDGTLIYEVPSAAFHTEYYVDRAPSGDERNITYTFEAPYAINALRVSVQQPARSTGFTVEPAADPQQGSDGLTYHIFNRTGLAAGEQVEITISYAKSDTGLTSPLLSVAPTAGPAQAVAETGAAAATSGLNSALPYLLIGLGVVLLAGILAYWILSQRRAVPEVVAPPPSRVVRATGQPVRPRRPVTAPAERSATAFCTNCGNALQGEDRFCSQCGAPRRA